MKTTFTLLIIPLILSFSACYVDNDGPMGPQGPRGLQGPVGPQGAAGESGYVFEYENINFTAPDYEVILSYPDDFEGLASDVAIVYFLWDVQNIDGEDVEIWRQLPQQVIVEGGLLQYNFDFSKYDTRLFLDANFPLDELTAVDTDEWVARVVIVPGDFWNSSTGRKASRDYNELKDILGLPDFMPHSPGISRREIK